MVKAFTLVFLMKLAFISNRVLGVYAYEYLKDSFERLKLFKDGLNHFQLFVMPMISPLIII